MIQIQHSDRSWHKVISNSVVILTEMLFVLEDVISSYCGFLGDFQTWEYKLLVCTLTFDIEVPGALC